MELFKPPERLRKKPGEDVRTRYYQRYTEIPIISRTWGREYEAPFLSKFVAR